MSSAIWEKSIEDYCDELTFKVEELEERMVKLEAVVEAARKQERREEALSPYGLHDQDDD